MRVEGSEVSAAGWRGVVVPLRTMAVAAAVAGIAAWVWIVHAVNADCDGWGCLGVYIVGLPILVIAVFLASWMGFRLAGTRLPALVIICAMITVMVVMGLFEPQTHGSVWAAVIYSLASGYWAWAFVPGRDLRFAAIGLGAIPVILLGHELYVMLQLASDERKDIEATGIQPLLLKHEEWAVVSADDAYDGQSLKLIYDEDTEGDRRRIGIEIYDLPPQFAPEQDCYQSLPAPDAPLRGEDPPTLACEPLASDLWRVGHGRHAEYLARIGDSAVTLRGIGSQPSDGEAREIIEQLEPVSVSQFASAD